MFTSQIFNIDELAEYFFYSVSQVFKSLILSKTVRCFTFEKLEPAIFLIGFAS